ncbi:glycosyltransferase family 39 protein [Patescibacteria group bacterium]|nr:glycosyltransferase family 39 protein [Patescibacteria group bacterium]
MKILQSKSVVVVLLLLLLLGLMGGTAVLSIQDDSFTNDEIAHTVAGYSYLIKQDYRLNPEHPPLAKDLAALPLLFLNLNFPDDDSSWQDATNGEWVLGPLFLYRSGNDADQILFWSRLPMIAALLVFGLFLFYWTRKLAGIVAAFLVLVLFTFSPNFLAHGRLVTTDVAAAFGIVMSLFWYLKFLSNPFSARSIVFAGLSLGAALLLKFSTVLLIPLFLFLGYVYLRVNSLGGWTDMLRHTRSVVLVGLVALALVGVVYQLHITNYPAERQLRDSQSILARYYGLEPQDVSFGAAEQPLLRPYAHYLLGLFRSLARVQMASIEYFAGETGLTGWWYYFPVLYLVKIPIGFHLLSLIALATGVFALRKLSWRFLGNSINLWIRSHFTEFSMASFIVVYSLLAITSPMNIGFRHMLMILPFVFILCALGIKKWVQEIPFPSLNKKIFILIILLGWYVFSSASVFPHYLSYYNELAGGVSHGYKIAAHSNYDWGQDLKRLSQWVDSEGIETIYLDFFGRAEPGYYLGDKYIPWKGSSWWGLYGIETDDPADFPKGNYLAVSATFLASGGWTEIPSRKKDYAWLDAHDLVARPGPSIFIYYIR